MRFKDQPITRREARRIAESILYRALQDKIQEYRSTTLAQVNPKIHPNARLVAEQMEQLAKELGER